MLIVNAAFVKENLPDEFKKLKAAFKEKKKPGLGVSINLDRSKKVLHLVFDPHKNMPQYIGRSYTANVGSIQITNKILCDDIWTLFGMPEKARRQFFTTKILAEVEGKKVFALTYDAQSAENKQALIQSKN